MTQNFSDQQLKYWIENDDPWLLNEAQKLRRQWYGDQVYVRGLIEFSNYQLVYIADFQIRHILSLLTEIPHAGAAITWPGGTA